MNVLVVDIGGTSVKILATGQTQRRKCPSGRTLTPSRMVAQVKELAGDWPYDVVSIGYPGPVVDNRATTEPRNLARGWVGFEFAKAFGCPVKVINDAAMQALGSYNGGTMLFLGFGTGLGSALMVRGHIVPMELGTLSYGSATIEDYVGDRGLQKLGKQRWRKTVKRMVVRFTSALLLDETVIGGGNARRLKKPPSGCRIGTNANAFIGGFRMWEPSTAHTSYGPKPSRDDPATKGKDSNSSGTSTSARASRPIPGAARV